MKLKTFTLISFIILCTLAHSASKKATIESYYGNNNYQFTEMYSYLKVNMDKKRFESFSIKVSNLKKHDLKNVCFNLRPSQNCFVKVVISDGNDIIQPISQSYVKVNATEEFQEISFNFSNYRKELTHNEAYFIFYIQPGTSFKGSLDIQDICAKDNNETYNSEVKQKLQLYPSPAAYSTNVVIPNNSYNQIVIIDAYKRVVLQERITKCSEKSHRLNLSQLSRGVYTVMLQGKNKNIYSNLIIRK